MKKISYLLIAVLIVTLLASCLVACDGGGDDNGPKCIFTLIDGKGIHEQQDVEVTIGKAYTPPTLIDERGIFAFVGWYQDKRCSVPWENATVAEKNTKLYSKWSVIPGHTCQFETSKVVAPTCLFVGYDLQACPCGETKKVNVVPALGHDVRFDDPNDYFYLHQCERENCDFCERRESLGTYDDVFVVTYTPEYDETLDALYQAVLDALEVAGEYDPEQHGFVRDSELYRENRAFEAISEAYDDAANNIAEQYQYAYVFYSVSMDDESTDLYDLMTKVYNREVARSAKLYRLIYESKYREYYFSYEDGWTDEDIQIALNYSDTYGNDECVAIRDRIDEIQVEFDKLGSKQETGDEVLALFEELVAKEQELAQLAGYSNYIDYAYENVYERDYSPADTKQMRTYVKQYISPLIKSIDKSLDTAINNIRSDEKLIDMYYTFFVDSMFSDYTATKSVGDFLKTMNTTESATAIDFFAEANDLLKNGNYYLGVYDTAYSYWISAQKTSILYFGEEEDAAPFTFIHEFGHYMDNVYNEGKSISMDLNETHSQGDEYMYLAFLKNWLPESLQTSLYPVIYYQKLYSAFLIIGLASAVDEFEYCVYTCTNPDGTPHLVDEVQAPWGKEEYDDLFNAILDSYSIDSDEYGFYWRVVTTGSPCYYISYAMSLLPCLQVFIHASNDYDAGKASYLKLFYFGDEEEFREYDSLGAFSLKGTYADVLHYAGYNSPFEEDMYKEISKFFSKS